LESGRSFYQERNSEGRDVLIEGVAVLPELISRLDDIPYRAVLSGIKEKITKRTSRNLLMRMS